MLSSFQPPPADTTWTLSFRFTEHLIIHRADANTQLTVLQREYLRVSLQRVIINTGRSTKGVCLSRYNKGLSYVLHDRLGEMQSAANMIR